MKHDNQFKSHFLQKTLGIQESINPEDYLVHVEPAKHADLLIEHNGRDHVAIVEFKVYAGLDSHQNPAFDKFWEKSDKTGYGWRLLNDYTSFTRKTYAVLQPDGGFANHQKKGVNLRFIHWADLVPDSREETRMEKDLFDSLAHLKVPGLLGRNCRNMKKAEFSKHGAEIILVLQAVAQRFGIKTWEA